MKFDPSLTSEITLSSSELVKQLAGIANEEGISFAESVRRSLESGTNKELLRALKAFEKKRH